MIKETIQKLYSCIMTEAQFYILFVCMSVSPSVTFAFVRNSDFSFSDKLTMILFSGNNDPFCQIW